jgi:dTDP-4-dehydrorhamnose reductase
MAKILLTGNRGFFGSRLQRAYEKEHEIVGVDKDEIDIVDAAAVTELLHRAKPELIIHAAAVTSTDFSDENPELTRKINVDGATNVAKAASKVGAKLIFFSTEQVFNGNREPGPYSEESVPQPNTMYGETKLAAEQAVAELIDDLWILRFTWLFGLPERNMPVNPNILWNALRIAATGRRTRVATNEYRGHTYGYDMIERVMRVPSLPYGTYHIGSRCDLGRYELTCLALKYMGLGQKVGNLVEADDQKYAVPRDVRLDTKKISDHGINFDPSELSVERALKEFGLFGTFG